MHMYESFEECITYLKDYATRKESVAIEDSQQRANVVSGEKSNLSDYYLEDVSLQDDVDPLHTILQKMDADINFDNFCLINFIMNSSKSDNSLFIPKNARKLLIQVYGKKSRNLWMHESC